MKSIKLLVCLASLFCLLPFPSCSRKKDQPFQSITFQQGHMGTRFTIRIRTQQGQVDEATLLSAKAFDRIAELDRQFSDYLPNSDLNQLAAAPENQEIPVSRDLFDIFSKARQLYEKSGGAFDITIGPLIRLWRLSRKNHQIPTPQQIAKAKERSGFQHLKLNPAKRSIEKDQANMVFDLGGIAKGYAADEALKILRAGGFPQSLVAASGDIAIGDPPAGKDGWVVGIETLELGVSPEDMQTVTLANAAISTSGDSRQAVEIDGVRYSHIVNPETGLGLTERIGVSVIAPDATTSDSYATTVCILGKKEGLKFIRNTRGVECQIVKIQDGREVYQFSDGFHSTKEPGQGRKR